MASKSKTKYLCSKCGHDHLKWQGSCSGCGEWGTLEEFKDNTNSHKGTWVGGSSEIKLLGDIDASEFARIPSGIKEFDRVLGGGFVQGSVVLIGGDPGIGKSTLLLQAISLFKGKRVYVSGEESEQQIALRSKRLKLDNDATPVLTEVQVEVILQKMESFGPELIIIDSIQTLYSSKADSAAGSVSQVRECTAQLLRYAKNTGTIIILVGHVTKDGTIAGPKILEHMVDTVLYFEGDVHAGFRLLRAVKNRFGAAGELGVFAMTGKGLEGVDNPSLFFMAEHAEPVPGTTLLSAMEGDRPLVVEVQALLESTKFPTARKLSVGFDSNRISMLVAVLSERGGLPCADFNIYINAVGGLKLVEPAADLAIALACASGFKKRVLPRDLAVFGEIGLGGEIRPVLHAEARINEAKKLGFKKVIMPKTRGVQAPSSDIELVQVRSLSEAIAHAFPPIPKQPKPEL